MTVFQIFLLSVLSLGIATVFLLAWRRAMPRLAAAVIVAVLAGGIVFAIKPELTTAIAHRLGIARGTDLLLYILILAVVYGFIAIYLKLRRVRRELTLLVREIAIREAVRNDEDASKRERGES
ncbi:MAG: hypothetical protein RIR10_831 [Planctomycetota bacterium]|jgi:hypothetical protein